MKAILKLFTFAAVAVIFASCASEEVTENYIPEDAIAVAKVDLASLYEKSLGDGSETSKRIMDFLRETVNQEDIPAPAQNIILNSLNNPINVFGLNLNQPVLCSATIDVYEEQIGLYISLPLSDRILFKSIIEKAYEDSEDYALWATELGDYMDYPEPYKTTIANGVDFYYFGDMLDMGCLCLAITNHSVICYVSPKSLGNEGKVGQKAIKELLGQKGTCDGPGFDKFMASSNDASIWLDVDALMDEMLPLIRKEEPQAYAVLKQFDSILDGLNITTSLDFELGKTVLTASVSGSDEYEQLLDKYTATSTDKYFSMIPSNSALVANFAISKQTVSDVWESLSNAKELSMYMGIAKQFGVNEEFIAGLPGTITMGLALIDKNTPSYSLAIECDKYVYDIVMSLLETFSGMVENNNDGSYSIYTEEYDYYSFDYDTIKKYIGYVKYVDGAAVVMSTDFWYATSGGQEFPSSYASSESSKIANGGCLFDFTKLPESMLAELVYELSMELNYRITSADIFEYFSSMVLTHSDGESRLECNMTDKKHNLLQKMIALLSDFI